MAGATRARDILKLRCADEVLALVATEPAILHHPVRTLFCLQQLGKSFVPASRKPSTSPQDVPGICRILHATCDHMRDQRLAPRDACTILRALSPLRREHPRLCAIDELLLLCAELLASTPRAQPLHSEVPGSVAMEDLVDGVRALAQIGRDEGRVVYFTSRLPGTLLRRSSELSATGISKLSWALVAMDMRFADSSPLLVALANQTISKVEEFSAFGISNVAWSFAKLALPADTPAQVGPRTQLLWKALCRRAEDKLADFVAQDLAGLAWALASVRMRSEASGPLLRDLSASAVDQIKRFTPQQLSNLSWAFATLAVDDQELFSRIFKTARDQLQHLQPQSLANIAWAFASISHSGSLDLLQDIGEESARKLTEFSPQGLSNLVWSFAKVKVRRFHFHAAAEEARLALPSFKPQDATNFTWALASLVVPGQGDLLEDVAKQSSSRMSCFRPQNLANLLWSFATLTSQPPEAFFEAAESLARQHLGEFNVQALSNIVWAVAALEDSAGKAMPGQRSLFVVALSGATDRLQELSAQGLANISWACASLAAHAEGNKLLETVELHASKRCQDLTLRDTSNVAWSVVTLSKVEERAALLKLLVRRAEVLLEDLPAADEELATSILGLLWALAFEGRSDEGQARRIDSLGRQHLLELGRSLDSKRSVLLLPMSHTSTTDLSVAYRAGAQEPSVVLDLPDRLVLFKPPGWEVDQSQGEQRIAQQLSSFLRMVAPPVQWPITGNARYHHGFLHRLDVPSSGLILVGKTYTAYYDLAAQLNTGSIVRDYVVLCHGWVPSCRVSVEARVLWSEAAGSGTPTQASEHEDAGGKPSQTKLKVLAHAMRGEQRFSLVAVRIVTGRRHQIRSHMKLIGHPTVCDGKYGGDDFDEEDASGLQISCSEEQRISRQRSFKEDQEWCPQNFLHRYRLAFRDLQGRWHEAIAPLPLDLKQALLELAPCAGAAELVRWREGEGLQDWELLPRLAPS